MNIKNTFIYGAKWTSIEKLIYMLGGFLLTLILVRLLDKEDFGLMAMSNIVIGFSSLFIDMGISNAVIHKQDISDDQLSTLFWINIIIGITFWMVIFLVSPYIAIFFEEPRLTSIVKLVSLTFLFYALGLQHKALVRKDLLFKELSIISSFIFIISILVKITLAYLGYGVNALVYGALTTSALTGIIFFIFGCRNGYRPKFVFKTKQIGFFLNFGVYQMGEKSMNYFGTQIDNLLIGKLIGAESLGVYDILKQLLSMPASLISPILNTISFPIFSKVQNNPVLLKNLYLKILENLSFFLFPAYIGLIVVSSLVLQIFLGVSWVEYTNVFIFLCAYFLIRSIISPVGNLLLSKGRVDLGFYWNLMIFISMPFLIIFSVSYGLIGISSMLVIFHLLLLVIHYKFLIKKLIPVSPAEYLNSLKTSFIISCCMGVLTYLISIFLLTFPSIIQLCLIISVGAVFYFLMTIRLMPTQSNFLYSTLSKIIKNK